MIVTQQVTFFDRTEEFGILVTSISAECLHIRVVHGSHSWAIFSPFQTHFRLIFVSLAEKQTKGNEKWCEKWLP